MTRFRNVSKLLCFGGIYKVKRSQSGKTYVLTWKKLVLYFISCMGLKETDGVTDSVDPVQKRIFAHINPLF